MEKILKHSEYADESRSCRRLTPAGPSEPPPDVRLKPTTEEPTREGDEGEDDDPPEQFPLVHLIFSEKCESRLREFRSFSAFRNRVGGRIFMEK